jgi:hypothetical protein
MSIEGLRYIAGFITALEESNLLSQWTANRGSRT